MANQAVDIFRACIPLFNALSDPARQDIILLLAEHERLSVNEIAEQSNLSRPAISHHLKVMRDNQLVEIEQKGTQRHYSLSLAKSVEQLKALISIVESECIFQNPEEKNDYCCNRCNGDDWPPYGKSRRGKRA